MNANDAIRAFQLYQDGLKQGVVQHAREAAVEVLLAFITDLGHHRVTDAFDSLMEHCAAVSKRTTDGQAKRRMQQHERKIQGNARAAGAPAAR